MPLLDTDRRPDTLMPLIKKYIKPNSMIYSDGRAAYRNLHHGNKHLSINHSENFAGSHDPEIHTQNIERLWRDMKEWMLRRGIKSEYLAQYIAHYLFIQGNSKCLIHFFSGSGTVIPVAGRQKAISALASPNFSR